MRATRVRRVLAWAVGLCGVLAASPAAAQTNLQLWGNFTLNWVKSERLVYELDVEPKVLLAAPEGEPGWHALDLTPNVEYSPKSWLDLVSEVGVGKTMQTDNLDTWEVTPRVGVRFHLFSRGVPTRVPNRLHPIERPPTRRVADWELFVPIGDPAERFANKERIRAGLGYRRSFAWRFEAIYMWTRSRNTIEEGFKSSDNIIDIRVKRLF